MKIKWGVIGAAGIADRRTIPGLLLAKNAELWSVMDVDIGITNRIKEKYNARCAYNSVEALLSDQEIDAVYIASPVFCHAEQVRLAADANKHILVEKPIALNSAEAQDVVNYCMVKGVTISAGFMMRFASYHQEMKRIIASGKLGKIVNINAQFSCWYPEAIGAWRQDKKLSGGGALMDMGVHLIDLIQYITNEKIVKVFSFNDTKLFGYSVEDSSAILAQLEGGAYVNINSNFNIPDEASKWRIEFYGSNGRIIGDETIGQVEGGTAEVLFENSNKEYDANQNRTMCNKILLDVELGNMYTKQIESFSEAIINRAQPEVSAADAVYVQKVVEAAYLSSETGRLIQIK